MRNRISRLLAHLERGTQRRGGPFGPVAACAALTTALTGLLASVDPAHAIYLDPDRNFSFRGTVYSQATIATEDTLPESDPPIKTGQLKQHRNFYQPELEGKLTPYLKSVGLDFLDELSFRLTVWGFYDGVYDYGAKQFGERAGDIKFRKSVPFINGPTNPQLGMQTRGHGIEHALNETGRRRDVRDIYAHRWRFNEAYVNLSAGRFFFRIGRQSISWGESDTIGLIDANNPFDKTLFAPGLFVPTDEARIPLYTIRTTVQLFDVAGPFSSGFADMYWVPGMIDTEVGDLPVSSGSPYTPPPPANSYQVFQNLPEESFANSRYGFRLQSVIARDYTTSIWYYTTFPLTPSPRLVGISQPTGLITASLEQKLTNVIGAATTFFSDSLNAVVRSQVTLFNGEGGFNVAKAFYAPFSSGLTVPGSIPRVNILRGELGMDRNFFFAALNPSNSFTWVSAIVFESNLDDFGGKHDYRMNGLLKPSAIRRQEQGGAPAGSQMEYCYKGQKNAAGQKGKCDFINTDPVQFFVQSHIETEMFHGTVKPAFTAIAGGRGSLTLNPVVDYRFNDSLIGQISYIDTHTFGSVDNGFGTPTGLMRDRDQIWFRMTYQLN